jgi:hypothetical protein
VLDAVPGRQPARVSYDSLAPAERALDELRLHQDDRPLDEDLVVDAEAEWFVNWHMGRASWADAVRTGHITVAGPRPLAKAFPTWNKLSRFADVKLETATV